jgi:hypothetical protein
VQEDRVRQAAEIDARTDLKRNDKIRAKRMLGLTLETIAVQYGVTRERIRQLTDPNYIAPGNTARLSPDQRLARMEERHARERERVIKDQVKRVFAAWEALPPEAKELFRQRMQQASEP